MSNSKDKYWPFPLSDKERQSQEMIDKIKFLETVTAEGFKGIQYGTGMSYGAISTTRSGLIAQRGPRGRWEVRLTANKRRYFSAFVCTFQVAADAVLSWLRGGSVQATLIGIEDSLVVMGKSTPSYKIYEFEHGDEHDE